MSTIHGHVCWQVGSVRICCAKVHGGVSTVQRSSAGAAARLIAEDLGLLRPRTFSMSCCQPSTPSLPTCYLPMRDNDYASTRTSILDVSTVSRNLRDDVVNNGAPCEHGLGATVIARCHRLVRNTLCSKTVISGQGQGVSGAARY
jgi:hypothetical protein